MLRGILTVCAVPGALLLAVSVAVAPVVSEESFIETPYGDALVRLYHAERGSLLTQVSGDEPTASGRRFDTQIVSIVARRGPLVVFVMTQNDGDAVGPRSDVARNIYGLKARAQQVLLSLTIPAERR